MRWLVREGTGDVVIGEAFRGKVELVFVIDEIIELLVG